VPRSDFPYRPYGSRSVIYDSGNYQGCLDKALAARRSPSSGSTRIP